MIMYQGGKFRHSKAIAPDDFKCIKEFDHIQRIRSKNGCGKTTEKVFIYDFDN